MIRNTFRPTILAALFVLMQIFAATAQETAKTPEMSAEVQAWFVALTKVNHPRFKKIIAEDAKIELRDLGIVQTRQEFLDSLGEWDDATKDAILLTQMISSKNGQDVLEVCYRFKNNEQLNRETYKYADGKITSVVQELVGTKCTGF